VPAAPASIATAYHARQEASTGQAPYPLVTQSYRVESPYSSNNTLPSVLPPPTYDHQGGHYPSFSSLSHGVSSTYYYGQTTPRSDYTKSDATSVPVPHYTYSASPASSSPTTTPATPDSCYTDNSATSAFSSASNSALELAKSRMRKAKTIAPTVSAGTQSSTVGQTPMDRIMLILSKKCYTSTPSQSESTASSPKGRNFLLDRRAVSPTSPNAETPISPAASESSKVMKRPAKRFECQVCGKTCAQRTGLDTHMRVHTGERPYACRVPGCNSTFTQSGNRTTHEENHSGEKRFKCPVCGRGFGQRGNRNGHVKRHHRQGPDEKPFVCCLDDCSKAFTELGNLKVRHLQQVDFEFALLTTTIPTEPPQQVPPAHAGGVDGAA
jgi:transposase-like protein